MPSFHRLKRKFYEIQYSNVLFIDSDDFDVLSEFKHGCSTISWHCHHSQAVIVCHSCKVIKWVTKISSTQHAILLHATCHWVSARARTVKAESSRKCWQLPASNMLNATWAHWGGAWKQSDVTSSITSLDFHTSTQWAQVRQFWCRMLPALLLAIVQPYACARNQWCVGINNI